MRLERIAVVAALAAAASAPWVCVAQAVTFDDIVPTFPGSDISNCFSSAQVFVTGQGQCAAQLTTQGYSFTTATGLSSPYAYLSPSRLVSSPTNGTEALFVVNPFGGDLNYLSISPSDGALLSLRSFDFAELNASVNFEPFALRVTGVHADGSTISQSFVFDHQYDGAGPLADYQSASVSASFQDLVSARFQVIADPQCTGECFAPFDFSIDNVTLSTVAAIPEPSSVALMILPLAVLAALARRRRRRESQKM